ncbi:MAG: dethiobiotin synthase, partial [Pelagibacterales bacterium]|nr:dethiobiotin synthase [Pelagibacterales bacterium]
SGTDVGKTFFLENICSKLIKNNQSVAAVKPIISGFEIDDLNSDSAKILKSLNLEVSSKNLNLISPWQFKNPLSPNIAAEIEDKKIDFLEVVDFCKKEIEKSIKLDRFLFIETAGGIMTPINDEKTFLDLSEELKIPVLFISRNYLGTINHTLCAVEAMRTRNIIPELVLFNRFGDESNSSKVLNTIRKIGKTNTIFLDVFLD